MRMDYLQYLIEIDKYHSISAAAQELYLGQTTLSSIVKNIEDELGFAIFKRTHDGVQTTPEGDAALSLIWELNARLEEIKQLREETYSAYQIPITLSPTISAALTLPLNQRFLEQEPCGNLNFQTVLGEEVGTQVIKNDSNIGITYFTKPNLENYQAIASKYQIEVDVLLTDQLHFMVRKDHPLAAKDHVSVNGIDNCNFAMLPHFSTDENSMAYIKYLGSSNQYTTVPNVALIKQAVLSRNAVAILSGYACYHACGADGTQMKVLGLDDTRYKNEIYLCLIHRSDSNICYQEKVLINCIREYFELLELPDSPSKA